MEQAVEASGLEHVIFRPSFVFGRDGGVLPTFVRQVRWSPLTPVLGTGERRLQPIWVEDVAAHFAASIDLPAAANRIFELGGPDAVTWNELYRRIAVVLGKRRSRVNIPIGLVRPAAAVAELLPEPADHPRPADDAGGRRQRLRHRAGAGGLRNRRALSRRAAAASGLR